MHLVAAGEVPALAKRQGLPLDLTLEILRSGAAGSWMLADRGPRMVAGQFDHITSAADIFVKDMSLVLDATREARLPAALAHAAYLPRHHSTWTGCAGGLRRDDTLRTDREDAIAKPAHELADCLAPSDRSGSAGALGRRS